PQQVTSCARARPSNLLSERGWSGPGGPASFQGPRQERECSRPQRLLGPPPPETGPHAPVPPPGQSAGAISAIDRPAPGTCESRLSAPLQLRLCIVRGGPMPLFGLQRWQRTLASLFVVFLVLGLVPATATTPAGRAVMAWHVTVSPSWFDPST